MAYTLQAIIAKSGSLPSELSKPLKVVQLQTDVALVPLGVDARKALHLPFLPLTDKENQGLSVQLHELCQRLSLDCSLAYIEAEFFGGVGMQAHALYAAGKSLGLPLISEAALNDAIRFVGSPSGESMDEFDTAGLGLHRDTDSWLK